jgi:pantothenate kinase
MWSIATDRKLARSRLLKRYVASGIVLDEAAADHRITSTDFLNADDIEQNRLPAQEIIDGDVQL